MVIRLNQQTFEGTEFLTTREVSRLTGYSVRTVQRYANEGLLSASRGPGKFLFQVSTVAEFLGVQPSPNHSQPSALIN